MAWQERAQNKAWNSAQVGSLGKPSHIKLESLNQKYLHHIPRQIYGELPWDWAQGAWGWASERNLWLRSCNHIGLSVQQHSCNHICINGWSRTLQQGIQLEVVPGSQYSYASGRSKCKISGEHTFILRLLGMPPPLHFQWKRACRKTTMNQKKPIAHRDRPETSPDSEIVRRTLWDGSYCV